MICNAPTARIHPSALTVSGSALTWIPQLIASAKTLVFHSRFSTVVMEDMERWMVAEHRKLHVVAHVGGLAQIEHIEIHKHNRLGAMT